MSISIESRKYELNATSIAGGAAGAYVGTKFAMNVAHSPGMEALSDAAGVKLGGRMHRVPGFVAGVAGSFFARSKGADDSIAAAAAHGADRLAQAAPKVEKHLGEVAASEGANTLVRGAAKAGETVMHEAPGVLGSILGAKGARMLSLGILYGAVPVGAAIAGGAITSSILPAVRWTND